MDDKGRTLAASIGNRLRDLRGQSGVTADDVAKSARMFGLGWRRQTVNAIERGTRDLKTAEFLMLPVVCAWAGVQGVDTVRDLLPAEDDPGRVSLADDLQLEAGRSRVLFDDPGRFELGDFDSDALGEFAAGMRRNIELGIAHAARLTALLESAGVDKPTWGMAVKVERAAAGEAETKAAAKFGATADAVAAAAFGLWGDSLTAERERRAAQRTPTGASSRSRQAIRGHVSRELLAELEPHVQTEGK